MAAEQLGPVRTCCRPRFLSLVGKLSSQYDQKNPQKQQRNVQKRLLGWQRCCKALGLDDSLGRGSGGTPRPASE